MAVVGYSRLHRSRLTTALLAALLAPVAGAALAQEATPATADQTAQANQDSATDVDAVVVTGSRIKRASIEGPAPVTVVTAADIEKEGFTTVYDALNTLTQFTGSVQNELTQNGFTPNASFLNLRGLGPGYQLILINGRRAADYPLPYNSESNATNLANIPAAAIERIEILTGGASAIYGSDAVAGVVNIILKKNYDGDQLTVRAGTTTRGGGDTGQVQWVGGKTGDNWSVTYAFESLEREALYASQRDFMDSYLDDPSVPDEDVNPVEGLLAIDLFDSNRLTPDSQQASCGRFSEFDIFVFEQSQVYTGPRCGYFGYPATQAIRNSDSNQSFYVNGEMDFTDNLTGFIQLYHTRAKAKLTSGVQFWSSDNIYLANLQSPFMADNFGAPGSYVGLQRIFTPAETGGALTTTIEEKSYDFAAGLRGSFGDGRFDWDATLSRAQYKLDSRQPRFLANNLVDYFLGPELPEGDALGFGYAAYNLNIERFFNPIDPAAFASLNTIVKDQAESSVNQASFVVSGDLFELPAGALGMATVLEAASQEYEINPDPRTNPNYTGPEPIYNLTSTGGGGDRDRYAVGVEFSIPVFDSLKLSAAGRWDKFVDASQIDDATTWQFGVEWRPFSNLLIRGSHGTSFRAPDMHYIYAEESGFFTSIFDEYKCRADGFDPTSKNDCQGSDYNYQVSGTRSGDRDLEAEKGKSTTVGFVWDVIDNMSISMDYYDIELRDAVRDISGLLFRNEAECLLGTTRDGEAVDPNSEFCQFYTSLVNREDTGGPFNDGDVTSYVSFPINQTLNRTTGIDAAWRYKIDTDRMGEFTFGLNWTHVLTLEQQEFEGERVEDIRDHPQFFNNRSRISGNVVWEKNDWTTAVYYTRWGSLPNWAETGRIGPQILWNLNVSKEITEKATVGLYINNVFDRIHPRDDTFNTYPFFWRQFSPVGREVFVQFDYKFN